MNQQQQDLQSVRIVDSQPVRIVDIDMPIGSMVSFMIKWAIAAIPALLLLSLLGVMITFVLFALSIAG